MDEDACFQADRLPGISRKDLARKNTAQRDAGADGSAGFQFSCASYQKKKRWISRNRNPNAFCIIILLTGRSVHTDIS